jgi:hypothetical protein
VVRNILLEQLKNTIAKNIMGKRKYYGKRNNCTSRTKKLSQMHGTIQNIT